MLVSVFRLKRLGAFKYYISELGGLGGLTQIADVADALRSGWGVWDWNADVILEYVHSNNGNS